MEGLIYGEAAKYLENFLKSFTECMQESQNLRSIFIGNLAKCYYPETKVN